jgi:signal transduction histidine kinase
MLLGAGLFVYVRLRADLDEAVDQTLGERSAGLALVARKPDPTLEALGAGVVGDPEQSFGQVLDVRGRVVYAAGGARGPALRPDELARSLRGPVRFERPVAGVEGPVRLIARQAGARVIVAGESLDDRDQALHDLVRAFLIGGPLAVVLASGIGYLLARAGLAPVEAMRRRAAHISLTSDDERLPLPAARDEVRRLGETLNDMLDRLRRSFERERRFVADASHELRTPIAVLKTELDGALRAGDYGPDVRDALVAAVEECDHLAQLAEDLLIVARAHEGRLPVRREGLVVQSVLAGVSDRFSDRAREYRRVIRVDADESLSVSADPLRVRQALGNLVDNALRHGGGEVVLRGRRLGRGVALEVADQGAGFSPDIAARAFERFAAGDHARTGRHAGLGMAIVRSVAEAHGGSAVIVPGPSATVRVWLPDGDPDASV